MSDKESNKKQPYEKPQLMAIELTTEEIMGACKISANTPGAGQPHCAQCSHTWGGS